MAITDTFFYIFFCKNRLNKFLNSIFLSLTEFNFPSYNAKKIDTLAIALKVTGRNLKAIGTLFWAVLKNRHISRLNPKIKGLFAYPVTQR